jgi:hypothetical protein
MVKFGLYDPDSTKPLQEYEGEFLNLNGDTVCVIANDDNGTQRVVVT